MKVDILITQFLFEYHLSCIVSEMQILQKQQVIDSFCGIKLHLDCQTENFRIRTHAGQLCTCCLLLFL